VAPERISPLTVNRSRAFYLVVLTGVALFIASTAAADTPQSLWNQVKASLKQGAYREALQSLDALQAASPQDPWAPLYRSLCELRLQSPSTFAQISPAQLAALKAQLRLE